MPGCVLSTKQGDRLYYPTQNSFVRTVRCTSEWRDALYRFERAGDFPYPDDDAEDYDAQMTARDNRIREAFIQDLCSNWNVYGPGDVLDSTEDTAFRVVATGADGKDLGDVDHDVLFGNDRIWYLTRESAQAAADRFCDLADAQFWGEDEDTGEPNPAPVYFIEERPVDATDPLCMMELFQVRV